MVDIKVRISATTSKLKEKMASARKVSANTIHQMVTSMRRTAQIGIAFNTAMGGVLDQTYAMSIEAGLLMVEFAAASAAASAAGTPIGFIRSGLQLATIGALLATITMLELGKADSARRIQGGVQMLRLLTF